MDNKNKKLVSGLFKDRQSADHIYHSLEERGYGPEDVHIVMTEDTKKKHFNDETGEAWTSSTMEGAGKGSAIGGAVGAIAGIIAAIGTSVAIPGLGLVVAGPIAAGLAGAGAGGITGGIIGALASSGIPDDHAKKYESGIKEGKIWMGVHPRNDEDMTYFEKQWRDKNGENIYTR